MSLNKRIVVSILIIIAVVAGCYGFEYFFKGMGLKSATVINVSYNNTTQAMADPAMLKQLPGQVIKNKQNHEGPTLSAVLAAEGVSNYSKVLVKGLKAANSYEVTSSQINDNLIFYFTDHNTVNLGNRSDYPHFLVQDVTEINAEK